MNGRASPDELVASFSLELLFNPLKPEDFLALALLQYHSNVIPLGHQARDEDVLQRVDSPARSLDLLGQTAQAHLVRGDFER